METTSRENTTRTRYHVNLRIGMQDALKYETFRNAELPVNPAGGTQYSGFMETHGYDTEAEARSQAAALQARYPEATITLGRAEQAWYPGSALGDKAAWYTTREVAI